MEKVFREQYANVATGAPIETLCDNSFKKYAFKRPLVGNPNDSYHSVEYSFARRSIVVTLGIEKTKEVPSQRVYAELAFTCLDSKEEVEEVKRQLEEIIKTA